MEPFWILVNGGELRQGDFLSDCLVPVFRPTFGSSRNAESVPVHVYDLVILTQSCDLDNKKSRLVALSPIHSIASFSQVNARFKKSSEWEAVRKGRVEGLHLLASPTVPDDNRQAYVVDFREVHSLPIDYLTDHAVQLGPRWRLTSPYLEHFSQSFARFFMRVGLPSTIPAYQ